MVNLTLMKINYFVDKQDINIIECTNNVRFILKKKGERGGLLRKMGISLRLVLQSINGASSNPVEGEHNFVSSKFKF